MAIFGIGTTPQAPNFTQAAQQTADSSQQNVNQQTLNNRANQNNPFGSLNWTQDPTTGQWTQNVNLNQTPTSSPAAWLIGTTYSIGQAVAGSDGIKYTSVGSGNIGNNPVGDSGANWTNTGILVAWTTTKPPHASPSSPPSRLTSGRTSGRR